jgi:hypothetical protein
MNIYVLRGDNTNQFDQSSNYQGYQADYSFEIGLSLGRLSSSETCWDFS